MSKEISTQENKLIVKEKQVHILQRPEVKEKFKELLGTRTSSFLTSVLSAVNSNENLKHAEQNSVYMAAMMAASLDLPINQNLGFAYIIPYKTKIKGENGQPDTYRDIAQFQMGYKGFIQLCLRSGQFKTISCSPVYEGQLQEENPLTGFVFDWKNKVSEKVIGYAAYFSLINGFEKTMYMNVDQIKNHGNKYSKSFKLSYGLWNTDFDAMASKTVVKLLLSKYAPMSVEMQKAVIADQSVIKDASTNEVEYIDINSVEVVAEEKKEAIKEKVKSGTQAKIDMP